MPEKNSSPLDDSRSVTLLRLPAVKQKTGYSKSSIYLLEARGEFPRRVRLGARAVAWSAAEIEKWIAEKIAARDGGVA